MVENNIPISQIDETKLKIEKNKLAKLLANNPDLHDRAHLILDYLLDNDHIDRSVFHNAKTSATTRSYIDKSYISGLIDVVGYFFLIKYIRTLNHFVCSAKCHNLPDQMDAYVLLTEENIYNKLNATEEECWGI